MLQSHCCIVTKTKGFHFKSLSFGLCSATNCGMPVVPEHGLVSYNDTWSGSVANYSCEEGFTVQGSQSVVCSVEGEWLNHPNCTSIYYLVIL